jgi:hypothetical protein
MWLNLKNMMQIIMPITSRFLLSKKENLDSWQIDKIPIKLSSHYYLGKFQSNFYVLIINNLIFYYSWL